MAITRATRGLSPSGDDQRDRASNRYACQRQVVQIELVQKAFHGRGEESGVVASLGNVRIAVARVVQGIDGEMLGELRYHVLEQIQLRSERVEKDESRTLTGLDIAELVSADLHSLDRDIGRPAQFCRRFRRRLESLDHEGYEPHADSHR